MYFIIERNQRSYFKFFTSVNLTDIDIFFNAVVVCLRHYTGFLESDFVLHLISLIIIIPL